MEYQGKDFQWLNGIPCVIYFYNYGYSQVGLYNNELGSVLMDCATEMNFELVTPILILSHKVGICRIQIQFFTGFISYGHSVLLDHIFCSVKFTSVRSGVGLW